MLELLRKWYPEDDPITLDQAKALISVLGDQLTEEAFEGFLIICSRLVDEFGGHRTDEMFRVFKAHTDLGRRALLRSLEHMNRWVGGMDAYERLYPVTIHPPLPAFPQLKIVGLETLADELFRVVDSNATVPGSGESTSGYIRRTGRLPDVPIQTLPVLREKPIYHWCSYDRWESPEATRQGLQILPEWGNDCSLRATIRTVDLTTSAFVAFNGDRNDPSDRNLRFYKYFFEPTAQDHDTLSGGGTQIGLEGGPRVHALELWGEAEGRWETVWRSGQ